MKFGIALTLLQEGACEGIRLPQWKEDVVIKLQSPDENSKMTHPYLYVESRFGCVPWKETVVEMFSDKWELVNPINTKGYEIEADLRAIADVIVSHIDTEDCDANTDRNDN